MSSSFQESLEVGWRRPSRGVRINQWGGRLNGIILELDDLSCQIGPDAQLVLKELLMEVGNLLHEAGDHD